MSRLRVRLGDGKLKPVEAFPLVPGLQFHRSPGGTGFNVTHTRSGMAVLTDVDEPDLIPIREPLGRKSWDVPEAMLVVDDQYIALIEEARKAMSEARDESRKQEKKLAEDLGGRVQPGSGSVAGKKRDVVTPKLLLEAKTTLPGSREHKYYIKSDDIAALRKSAYQEDKVPVFLVSLHGIGDAVVIPWQDLPASITSGEKKTMIKKKYPTLPVNKKLVDNLTDTNVILVSLEAGNYGVINYHRLITEIAHTDEVVERPEEE